MKLNLSISLPSPLTLDAADRRWVDTQLARLTTEEKIAQLFIFSTREDSRAEMEAIVALKPGGIHRFPTIDLAAAHAATRIAIEESDIPPLISGDIEGGATSYGFVTPLPNQLGIAACDDLALSRRIAEVIANESRMLGYNWSFTPVIDINATFRNAVVGTRSYGSDVQRILDQALVHIEVMQSHGIATTAKHWPGEGYDERDQHLVTTVNPLDPAAWDDSFGYLYRGLIQGGVMAVMSAHIALPGFVRSLFPDAGREAFRPASVSKLLNQTLLRERLGFQGLIVSDATVMGGLMGWSDRVETVPAVIENGCDMFLFSRNPAQDIALMQQGLREGRLSEQRLEEAVDRILSLKARLGLHRKTQDEMLPPLEDAARQLCTPSHLTVAAQAAGDSLTLVKDSQSLLPLSPSRHRRVVISADEGWNFFDGALPRSFLPFRQALEAEGFEVRDFDADALPKADDTDLLIYLVGQEATPSLANIFMDWTRLHGGPRKAMYRFSREIPTLLISFGQPFYLFDAPDVSTCINAYCSLDMVQEALVPRLLGQLPFTGHSPVDPFCGMEQLQW